MEKSGTGNTEKFVNVADYLGLRAAEDGTALMVAVAQSGRFWELSAAELHRRATRCAHALHRGGIRRGMRVVMMVTPSSEFFALAFALLDIGAVMVLVDPGMGIKNLGICLQEAAPQGFIGIPKAHIARLLFRWMRPGPEVLITVGTKIGWGGTTLIDLEDKVGKDPGVYDRGEPTAAGEMAGILFTSGSTGVPKGAIYTHGMFSAQVRLLRRVYGIQPGERDLSTFPLFALFGPALGMASVIPEMDASRPAKADPAKLMAAAERYKCTSMFANPALVNKIGRHGEVTGDRLPGLRRVLCAGAPIGGEPLRRLSRLLSADVEIFTPYGATECLPVCSIGSTEILGETAAKSEEGAGVCVGLPVAEMEVRIIAITDDEIAEWSQAKRLPSGEIGEIVVRGPVVSAGYFGREASTKLAKIQDDGGLWHRMGDLGYLDGCGRVWMCGRKSHRVVTSDGTMHTVCVEGVFNRHPKVFRSALVGVRGASGVAPVLCVELEKDVAPAGVVGELGTIAAAHGHTHTIQHFLIHPEFPVDARHNAKIFREKLAIWAQERVR